MNEARLGWNRFAEGFFPEDKSFEPSSIGLNTGVAGYDSGLPAIGVGGFSQIGATTSVPRNRVDSNWHFIDNYSWKAGRHDIKLGYEFRRTTIMHVIDHNFRGTLSLTTSLLSSKARRPTEDKSPATPCGTLSKTVTASTFRTVFVLHLG